MFSGFNETRVISVVYSHKMNENNFCLQPSTEIKVGMTVWTNP